MARWMRLLWLLLTSHGISSMGSPRVRARCFPAQPPHLPLRANQSTSLCCASSSLRIGLDMRFLSISSQVSPSLPSHGRLPFRSWLQMVVFSCFHVWFSYRGLAPRLQRAHAGHTQAVCGNGCSSLRSSHPYHRLNVRASRGRERIRGYYAIRNYA